jgi:hypothetical protein
MAIKHCPPKLTQTAIFGLKINHLATLLSLLSAQKSGCVVQVDVRSVIAIYSRSKKRWNQSSFFVEWMRSSTIELTPHPPRQKAEMIYSYVCPSHTQAQQKCYFSLCTYVGMLHNQYQGQIMHKFNFAKTITILQASLNRNANACSCFPRTCICLRNPTHQWSFLWTIFVSFGTLEQQF